MRECGIRIHLPPILVGFTVGFLRQSLFVQIELFFIVKGVKPFQITLFLLCWLIGCLVIKLKTEQTEQQTK